jgi:hypothetical protein
MFSKASTSFFSNTSKQLLRFIAVYYTILNYCENKSTTIDKLLKMYYSVKLLHLQSDNILRFDNAVFRYIWNIIMNKTLKNMIQKDKKAQQIVVDSIDRNFVRSMNNIHNRRLDYIITTNRDNNSFSKIQEEYKTIVEKLKKIQKKYNNAFNQYTYEYETEDIYKITNDVLEKYTSRLSTKHMKNFTFYDKLSLIIGSNSFKNVICWIMILCLLFISIVTFFSILNPSNMNLIRIKYI